MEEAAEGLFLLDGGTREPLSPPVRSVVTEQAGGTAGMGRGVPELRPQAARVAAGHQPREC